LPDLSWGYSSRCVRWNVHLVERGYRLPLCGRTGGSSARVG